MYCISYLDVTLLFLSEWKAWHSSIMLCMSGDGGRRYRPVYGAIDDPIFPFISHCFTWGTSTILLLARQGTMDGDSLVAADRHLGHGRPWAQQIHRRCEWTLTPNVHVPGQTRKPPFCHHPQLCKMVKKTTLIEVYKKYTLFDIQ